MEFTKKQLIEEAKQSIKACHTIMRVSPNIDAHKISLRLAEIALASLEADSDSSIHPAHGPLSNDRLQRISGILSKAAAQSDGGNIGYAMSDAVKAIDELLEVRKVEPVAFIGERMLEDVTDGARSCGRIWSDGTDEISGERRIPLYTAPPAQVVPDALPENDDEEGNDIDYLEPSQVYELGRITGWNACRAAMLQGAEPVTTAYMLLEGLVAVPVEPTMEMLNEFDSIIDYGAEDSKEAWSRLIAAAPQQEVKNV